MERDEGEPVHRPQGLWERPWLTDCHLCRGMYGGVRHGVEKPSTAGTLPQWYEWCTNWEYGPLAKEDPPILYPLCHCIATEGPESMVIEEASPSQGGHTLLPEA